MAKKTKAKKSDELIIAQPREQYIYILYARKGVGGQVYLGWLIGRRMHEVEEICRKLEEDYKDVYPRGIDYYMLGFDPDNIVVED